MKIAICDDDREQRLKYVQRIRTLADFHKIPISIVQFESGAQMLFELDSAKEIFNVVYLDINMPDLNGLTVAQRLLDDKNFNGEIIFLTKSDKYWKSAFDIKVYNYLVKGDDSTDRFEKVFISAIRDSAEKVAEHMFFSSAGQAVNISINKIMYFESIGRMAAVHYDGGKFDFYSTMGKVEEQLAGRDFFRVHRSYLVSLLYVEKFYNNTIELSDATEIPVGRAYLSAFKREINRKSLKITKLK